MERGQDGAKEETTLTYAELTNEESSKGIRGRERQCFAAKQEKKKKRKEKEEICLAFSLDFDIRVHWKCQPTSVEV